MNKDTYKKEGSYCFLTGSVNKFRNVSSEIESITDNDVQIRVTFDEIKYKINPNGSFNENRHETFSVTCDLKTRLDNITRETRTTRPIKGGGMYDEFIYGGGVTVVNSIDIPINNVSVELNKPPMSYNVSHVSI